MSSWRDAPVVDDTTTESAVPSWMSAPVVEDSTPRMLEESATPVQAPQATEDRFPNSPNMTVPTGRLLPMEGGQGRPPALDPDPNFPDSPSMTAAEGPLRPMGGVNFGMYKDKTFEEAREIYQSYKDDPNSTTGAMGEVIFDGTVVPFPERSLFGEGATVGTPQYTAGIVRNTARNTLETVGAVVDLASSRYQLFDKDGGWNPKIGLDAVQDVEPGFLSRTAEGMAKAKPSEGTVSELSLEAGPYVLGGLVGLKGADKLISGFKPLADTKFLKYIAKALGFEAGGAVAVDQDASTVVAGRNAMIKNTFPLLQGIPEDTTDSEAAQILKDKMNIVIDMGLIAGPAEAGIKGVAKVSTLLWSVTGAPLMRVFSEGSREAELSLRILDDLATVGKGRQSNNTKGVFEARKNLLDTITENEEVVVEMSEKYGDDIVMHLDVFTAVQRALQNNDSEMASLITTQARQMQTGATGPRISQSLAKSPNELERLTRVSEEIGGGEEAIAASGRRLVDEASTPVTQARQVADDIDLRIADAETNLENLLSTDKTFGPQLSALNEQPGIMVESGPNQTMKQIMGNIRTAREIMSAKKNELYGKIQGGEVKAEGLLNKLDDLRPTQLDAAIQETSTRDVFGTLLEESKRRTIREADAAGNVVTRPETDPERIERFTKWMQDNELDYGKLYREVRPSVSRAAEEMFKNKKSGGGLLREFNNYIDTQALTDASSTATSELAQNIQNARNYYIRDWAPLWEQGVFKEFGETYARTVGRTTDEILEISGREFRDVDFASGTRPQVEGVLNDSNFEKASHIIEVLKTPEAGQSAPLVTDYIIGRAVETLRVRMASGTGRLSDVELEPLIGELFKYSDMVAQEFPQQAQRINQFVNNITSTKNNISALTAQLDEATQIAKQAEEALYGGALSKFFKSQGVQNPDSYNVFASILNNNQSADTIAELLRLADASGDPLVRSGMQSAYSRFIREKVLSKTQERAGNRAVSLSALSNEKEGLTNFFEYGDQIYSDAPELMEAFRTLAELSGFVARSKGAKAVASDSSTSSRMEAIRASNQLITQTLGVLNKIGARVRAGTTAFVNRQIPDGAEAALFDALVADTPRFLELARKATGRGKLKDEDIVRGIYAFLLRGGILTADDGDVFTMLMEEELKMRERVDTAGELMEGLSR